MTLCNLSIEAGARLGLIAPDETTFAYVQGRPFAPKGEAFDRAVENWRRLASDADAEFDREMRIEARDIAPTVTWGVSPEQAAPIDRRPFRTARGREGGRDRRRDRLYGPSPRARR